MSRLCLLLLLTLPLSLFSQSRGPGQVTGRIIEKENNQPVEYANIVLTDTVTKQMVSGMVTDSSGAFHLSNIPAGIYFLDYSFIGYAKQRAKPVTISKKHPKAELGNLFIAASAIPMNEVNITADRTMMINKIDRKVFNVQTDIQAQTGTVTDILQTIPSLSLDMDGNITLRVSGSVTILINGRPSVLANIANLEQMPASLVEKIEIITNPSAKYRPDGTGGIINIILKKEQKAGFNGILGANAGSHDRYNANLQLNFNTSKVNLYGSYGIRQDYRQRTSQLSSQNIDTITQTSTWFEQNSTGYAMPVMNMGQLGIDWNPTKKDVTGASGFFNIRKAHRDDEASNLYSDTAKQPTQAFTRIHDGYDDETSLGVKVYYEHTFNKEDEHALKVDFDYQSGSESEEHEYTNNYTVPDTRPQEKTRATGSDNEQDFTLSASYTRPLWKDASMDAGYEGTIVITDQVQDVYDWDYPANQWIIDSSQYNSYRSNQTVHALYTTLSMSWGKFSVMGGLRAEEAIQNLGFRSLNATARNEYFALYPTLHTSLASGKNEWQLNYSRRVNRPDGQSMNPVPEYRDPLNIFVGNPDLKPEDIHSLEFGYAVKAGNLNFVPTLFYRYKVNGFTMVTSNLNDSVLVTTIDNLDQDQSAGIDLSGTWQIQKVMNFNFSASGFYSEIDASSIGYSSNRSTFSWNAKINASFYITKTTVFQFNSQYRSASLTAQGMREPSWVVNLGFRQDFWKKKLSLIVTVSDLFDSQGMKSTVNTPTLVQESYRRRDARVIYGGLVFNFGSKGKKVKETKMEFDNGM